MGSKTNTPGLLRTGVTPNTYGSGVTIPQIQVGKDGRIISASSVPVQGMVNGVFGNGRDGTAVADGAAVINGATLLGVTYTADRDLYYDNLTIDAGIILDMGGYRLYVKTSLTVNGNVVCNGENAIGPTGGSQSGSATGSLGRGGSGGSGSIAPGGGAGNAGTNITFAEGSMGGSGGSSLTGGLGNIGGIAGVPTLVAPQYGSYLGLPQAGLGVVFGSGGTDVIRGGSGGGGGGNEGGGADTAGGGGGGGGVLVVVARDITIAALNSFSVAGGNGGNAAGNAGGGGGGGGGVCILVYESLTGGAPANTDICPGGTEGVGAGTGDNGLPGSDGLLVELAV